MLYYTILYYTILYYKLLYTTKLDYAIPPTAVLFVGIWDPRLEVLDLELRPVHLLRVSLLRVLESNFPGDPLSNSTDIGIPTP